LGFETAFYNTQTDLPYPNGNPVGEVNGSPVTVTLAKKKIGATGLHVCGTPLDFFRGGVTDTVTPPVVYQTNGLPTCCVRVPTVINGVGVGGQTAPVIIPPTPPGPTCLTSAPFLVNGPAWMGTVNSGDDGWFVASPAPVFGENWVLNVTSDQPDGPFIIWYTNNCAALLTVGSVFATGIATRAASSTDFEYHLEVIGTNALPANVTFTWTET
jgi:hypothetical protein